MNDILTIEEIQDIIDEYGHPEFDYVVDVWNMIESATQQIIPVYFIKSMLVPGTLVYGTDFEDAYLEFLDLEWDMIEWCVENEVNGFIPEALAMEGEDMAATCYLFFDDENLPPDDEIIEDPIEAIRNMDLNIASLWSQMYEDWRPNGKKKLDPKDDEAPAIQKEEVKEGPKEKVFNNVIKNEYHDLYDKLNSLKDDPRHMDTDKEYSFQVEMNPEVEKLWTQFWDALLGASSDDKK